MTYDIGTDIVEEARVVRDNHTGHVGQVAQVLLEPSDGLDVYMLAMSFVNS